MAKLSSITAQAVPLSIDLGNDISLNFRYLPSKVTPARDEQLQDIQGSENQTEEYLRFILEPLDWWDLETEDSTPDNPKYYPLEPTPQNLKLLRDVPSMVFTRIAAKIMEDQSPNRKRSGSSKAFS